MTTLHAIGNWLYHFFGVGGSGPNYGFWSGTGSDIGEVTILGAVLVGLRRLNCHQRGCWRLGFHRLHDESPVKVCAHHHPELRNHRHRIPAEMIEQLHADHAAGRAATASKLDEIHRHVTALAPNAGDFPPPPEQ